LLGPTRWVHGVDKGAIFGCHATTALAGALTAIRTADSANHTATKPLIRM
jgi:hypothetical protein